MSQEARLELIEIRLTDLKDQLSTKYNALDSCNNDDEARKIRTEIKSLNVSFRATKKAYEENEWLLEFVPRPL